MVWGLNVASTPVFRKFSESFQKVASSVHDSEVQTLNFLPHLGIAQHPAPAPEYWGERKLNLLNFSKTDRYDCFLNSSPCCAGLIIVLFEILEDAARRTVAAVANSNAIIRWILYPNSC